MLGAYRSIYTTPHLWGNTRLDRTSRQDYVSPLSSFVFETTAPTFRCGYTDTIGPNGGLGYITVYVGGNSRCRPYAKFRSTAINQKLWSAEIPLPAGRKRVRVRNSPQSFNSGMSVDRILIPAPYDTVIVPEPTGKKIFIMGDSKVPTGLVSESTTIASGSNTVALPTATIHLASTALLNPAGGLVWIGVAGGDTPVAYTGLSGNDITGCTGGSGTLATGQVCRIDSDPFMGLVPLLEERIPDLFVCDGYGGYKLSGITSSADTSQFGWFTTGGVVSADNPIRQATLDRVGAANPTDIIIALLANDMPTILNTDAGLAVAKCLDDVHAKCPQAHIWFYIFGPLPAKDGHGAGFNCSDIRTAVGTVVAARAYWCDLIDGNAIVGGFGTQEEVGTDGLHETRRGYAMLADVFARRLGRNHT